MLKVVVAYIDPDAFEAVRSDLAVHGITSFSAAAAGGASTERFVAPHYRGSPQTTHMAEKVRLECVVGVDLVEVVKEVVFSHESRRNFLFVMDVVEAVPGESVATKPAETAA